MWFGVIVTGQPPLHGARQHNALGRQEVRVLTVTGEMGSVQQMWPDIFPFVDHLKGELAFLCFSPQPGCQRSWSVTEQPPLDPRDSVLVLVLSISKSSPEWWGSRRCRGRRGAPTCSSCGGTVCRNPADAGRPRPACGSGWTSAPRCPHRHFPHRWGSTNRHRPTTAPPVHLLRRTQTTRMERSNQVRYKMHTDNSNKTWNYILYFSASPALLCSIYQLVSIQGFTNLKFKNWLSKTSVSHQETSVLLKCQI